MKSAETAFAALDAYIARKMEYGSIPGLALGITDRGRVVGCRYYGYANIDAKTAPGPETLFEIGSISKSFASVVVLQLAEEGALDIHRPVDEYLPWFEARWKGERFTLHHLMSHTAGLPVGAEVTPEAVPEAWAVRDMELGCTPGQCFHYSNIGYKIVGLVIEAITGQSCADEILNRILRPLGMSRSHAVIHQGLRQFLARPYEPSPDDRPVGKGTRMMPAPWLESDSADGSISSTPEDMAAYMRMLLNKGAYSGGRLLSEESFGRLTAPLIRPAGSSPQEYYAYGLGVEVQDGRKILAHTGGMVGYVSAMRLDLGAGIGTIVLTNGTTDVSDVAKYALKVFVGVQLGNENPSMEMPYQLSEDEASQYVGDYTSGSGVIEIRSDTIGGLLVSHASRHGALRPQEKDVFSCDLVGLDLFLLRFGREDERVVELCYGGDLYVRGAVLDSRTPQNSDDLRSFCGHYRSCNPWLTNFRVLVRKGVLKMVLPSGEERDLVTLGNGWFRIGEEETSPERVVFGAIIDGKTQTANLMGQAYARTRTP